MAAEAMEVKRKEKGKQLHGDDDAGRRKNPSQPRNLKNTSKKKSNSRTTSSSGTLPSAARETPNSKAGSTSGGSPYRRTTLWPLPPSPCSPAPAASRRASASACRSRASTPTSGARRGRCAPRCWRSRRSCLRREEGPSARSKGGLARR